MRVCVCHSLPTLRTSFMWVIDQVNDNTCTSLLWFLFVHTWAGVVVMSEEWPHPHLIASSALVDYPELPISYSCSLSVKKPNETTIQRICEVLSSAEGSDMGVVDDDGGDDESNKIVRVGSSSVRISVECSRSKSSSSRLLLSSSRVKCSWSFEDAALAERCMSMLRAACV